MNEKLYEALEVCLQAIETGTDIESVLKRYPQMADELRPVLDASVQAHSLAAPSIPEAAMRRGRARVLQHAVGMRESARSPHRPIFSLPRLAASLALALIFILGGTGLVRASNEALPGDNLYPVKRSWEDMRLLLVFSPEGREELEDEFEQKRLHEINKLLAEGRHETITFAGLVAEQNGDQWVVSGIPVQITPDSKLPAEPVTVGASIMVEGRTNPQGFVEVERVEILEPGISLPPFEPAEDDTPRNSTQNENSGMEGNDNGDQDETEIENLPDDNNDNGEDSEDDNENNNASSDDGDDNNGPSGDNDSDDDDNSNSDSGGDDNNSDDDDSSNGDSGGDGDNDNGDDD